MSSAYFDSEFGNWLPCEKDYEEDSYEADYKELKIEVEVGKLSDAEVANLYSELWRMSCDEEEEQEYFEVEIVPSEDNDDWEHYSKIRLSGYCPDDIYYSVCDFLNKVKNIYYKELW